MKVKNILLSKTFWMNIIAIVAMFWPGVGTMLPEETLVMLLGAANVVMRLFTKDEVKVLPEKKVG